MGNYPDCQGFTGRMEPMRAMHVKMMAAKTPSGRAAAMQEQIALMQRGMTMMRGMQDSSTKRTDMMQMMMDRKSDDITDEHKPPTWLPRSALKARTVVGCHQPMYRSIRVVASRLIDTDTP